MGRLKTLRPMVQRLDTRCALPPPKEADAELLTPEHRKWRAAVLKRAGYRCEHVENGVRCTKTENLVADHVVERKDGGAPLGEGQCLCIAHNTAKGIAARARRQAAPVT